MNIPKVFLQIGITILKDWLINCIPAQWYCLIFSFARASARTFFGRPGGKRTGKGNSLLYCVMQKIPYKEKLYSQNINKIKTTNSLNTLTLNSSIWCEKWREIIKIFWYWLLQDSNNFKGIMSKEARTLVLKIHFIQDPWRQQKFQNVFQFRMLQQFVSFDQHGNQWKSKYHHLNWEKHFWL